MGRDKPGREQADFDPQDMSRDVVGRDMDPAPERKSPDPEESPQKRERRHVYGTVMSRMRRGLMIGAFLPGEVMSLRKLAAEFGTSAMPVREVLSRLVAANALEEMPSGSARVPRLRPARLRDLFAVREVVEGTAGEWAAKHGGLTLADDLLRINNELHAAIDKRDILGCLSLNQQFHFMLYEASGSDVLVPLIESLWLQFGPTMYMSLLIPSMPWDASHHEHVVDALRAGDGAGVRQAIVGDIRSTCAALLSVTGESGIADLPFIARAGALTYPSARGA